MSDSPGEDRVSTPAELKARLDAERRGGAFVVYRDGDGRQVIVPLSSGQLTVGRREDNDIALTWDVQVSRLHAQIEQIKGDWCCRRTVSHATDRSSTPSGSPASGGSPTAIVSASAPPWAGIPGSGWIDAKLDCRRQHRSAVGAAVRNAARRPNRTDAGRSPNRHLRHPATNQEIAVEVCLSVDAVKAHLRVLFTQFGLGDLPQNQKRAALAATVLLNGIIAPHEF